MQDAVHAVCNISRSSRVEFQKKCSASALQRPLSVHVYARTLSSIKHVRTDFRSHYRHTSLCIVASLRHIYYTTWKILQIWSVVQILHIKLVIKSMNWEQQSWNWILFYRSFWHQQLFLKWPLPLPFSSLDNPSWRRLLNNFSFPTANPTTDDHFSHNTSNWAYFIHCTYKA